MSKQEANQIIERKPPGNICSILIDGNGIIYRTLPEIYGIEDENENERKTNSELEKKKRQDLLDRTRLLKETAEDKWSQSEEIFKAWLLQLEKEHFKAISNELLKIVGQRPNNLFLLSFDGPAPLAKLKQQRERRHLTGMRQVQSTIKNNSPYPWPLFDKNSITPGTDFMIRLDTFIKKWIEANIFRLPRHVIYYSHMVPGEGEHRIMDDIRSGKIQNCAEGTGAHIIYGSDSDLALLALIAPMDNLYVARDNFTDIINVSRFRDLVYSLMKTETGLSDFVFLFSLIGNDFLPRPPWVGHLRDIINNLVNIYQRVNGLENVRYDPNVPIVAPYPLTNPDHSVNWEGVRTYFSILAQVEGQLLQDVVNKPLTYQSRLFESASTTVRRPGKPAEKVLNYALFRQLWYGRILSPISKLTPLEQELMGNFEPDLDVIRKLIVSYIQGLGWVNTYYHHGMSAINLDWFYPAEYTPLFIDISSILNELGDNVPNYKFIPGQEPINVVFQLLSVLPLASQDLLPIEVRNLMDFNSIIADLYPSDFILELDGKAADWQVMPLLPRFQPARIIKAVKDNVVFTAQRDEQYRSVIGLHTIRPKDVDFLKESKETFEKLRRKLTPQRGGRRGRGGFRGSVRERVTERELTRRSPRREPVRGQRGRGRVRFEEARPKRTPSLVPIPKVRPRLLTERPQEFISRPISSQSFARLLGEEEEEEFGVGLSERTPETVSVINPQYLRVSDFTQYGPVVDDPSVLALDDVIEESVEEQPAKESEPVPSGRQLKRIEEWNSQEPLM